MKVNDWDTWQTFRKDRGAPPWIKVHRSLMTSPKWAALTDAEKGQLVSLWIAAADTNGILPDSPVVLRKICQLDQEPNIKKFIELGLLVAECQPVDNQLTTTCQQLDAPEESRAEESRGDESREDQNTTTGIEAVKPLDKPDSQQVARAYAFEGRTIRLNHEDFAKWKKAYYRLDLISQLQRIDDWFEAHPEKQKDWFYSTSSMLGRNHDAAPEKRTDGRSACSARAPRRDA